MTSMLNRIPEGGAELRAEPRLRHPSALTPPILLSLQLK